MLLANSQTGREVGRLLGGGGVRDKQNPAKGRGRGLEGFGIFNEENVSAACLKTQTWLDSFFVDPKDAYRDLQGNRRCD